VEISVTSLRTVRRRSGSATTAASLGTNHQHAQSRAPLQPNNVTRAVASGTSKRNAQRFAYKAPTKNATIAAILDISRACVPTKLCKTMVLRHAYPPPGRGLNMASLPPIKCYRCGGPNHMARDCLAAPYSVTEDMNGAKEPVETCYKCKAPGHIARDCPEGREPVVEEDNTWGELESDPWSGDGTFVAADGN